MFCSYRWPGEFCKKLIAITSLVKKFVLPTEQQLLPLRRSASREKQRIRRETLGKVMSNRESLRFCLFAESRFCGPTMTISSGSGQSREAVEKMAVQPESR